jgi:signal transduction histidine kinase
VFSGLRSRLMLSFSALLLVCLGIVTVTFAGLSFVRTSLPELAYARLSDAAVPAARYVRNARDSGKRLTEDMGALGDLGREYVSVPDGTIIADAEQGWSGQQIQLGSLAENSLLRATLRGRARGPDHRLLFYMALAAQDPADQARRVYPILAVTPWQTARFFIGSMLTSAPVSGAIAFTLSVLLALWLARILACPLQHAAAAAEQVAAGDYFTLLDISPPDEARRLAESFNSMTRAVAASQRSQRDFVANVSHEPMAPLTSIRGFAQPLWTEQPATRHRSIAQQPSIAYGSQAARLDASGKR